jgi:hypothetical protein
LCGQLSGRVVASLFSIELMALGGRAKLGSMRVEAILKF